MFPIVSLTRYLLLHIQIIQPINNIPKTMMGVFSQFIQLKFETKSIRFVQNQQKDQKGYLQDTAPGLQSSLETLQRWRAVVHTVFDLTGLGIEPYTFRTDIDVRYN